MQCQDHYSLILIAEVTVHTIAAEIEGIIWEVTHQNYFTGVT